MAEKQVTTMVIKVDLECEKCAKKIKKVLCKIPQIQNQIYDKKANTVTVTVVCCSPEKIKQKICCKGGKTIIEIKIKVPEKPQAPEEQKPPEKPRTCCSECSAGRHGRPCTAPPCTAPPCTEPPCTAPPCTEPEKQKQPKKPRTCCSECNEGRLGGPCFHG